mmetsp:Transcript_2555/g.4711  ORF Transcript_2555/g.4711 Transcript_2555/m.4711 type:complete len:435 (+) Transcript_2555:379-1683(+)
MKEHKHSILDLTTKLHLLNPDILGELPTPEEVLSMYHGVSSRYFGFGERWQFLGDLDRAQARDIRVNLENAGVVLEAAYIIPFVDLLNHHYSASFVNVEKVISSDGRWCHLKATRPIQAHEPLRLSYGNWSNLELLAVYGFAMPNNPNGPKLFGVRSHSLPQVTCSLELSRSHEYNIWGFVSERTVRCLRSLAYDQNSYRFAVQSGYFQSLPGILEPIPPKTNVEGATLLQMDLNGYEYIHGICQSMVLNLKSSLAMAAAFKLAKRPVSDTLSSQIVESWLDEIDQAEACERFWQDKTKGISIELNNLEISQEHSREQVQQPDHFPKQNKTPKKKKIRRVKEHERHVAEKTEVKAAKSKGGSNQDALRVKNSFQETTSKSKRKRKRKNKSRHPRVTRVDEPVVAEPDQQHQKPPETAKVSSKRGKIRRITPDIL